MLLAQWLRGIPTPWPLWLVSEMINHRARRLHGHVVLAPDGTDEGSYPQPVFTVNDGVGARGVLLTNPTIMMGTRTV
jgi:hypothetical protein